MNIKLKEILMLAIACSLALPLQAQNLKNYSQQDLNEQTVLGSAWYYTSAEMKAISYQTYRMAKMLFDHNQGTGTKKRAVVVDIDETVLDNGTYQTRAIGQDFAYHDDSFNDWCEERRAKAYPGSVEFLNYASVQGADIFYISNRDIRVLQATIDNLRQLGFPQIDSEHVLLQTDTSDKEPRREIVRQTHEIILLIGDNLNDFSSLFLAKNIADRTDTMETVIDRFGTTFLLLPNPIYGSWEGSIYNGNWHLSPDQKNQARKKAIKVSQ